MPDGHDPEQDAGEEFRPSTPDLTPNLGEYVQDEDQLDPSRKYFSNNAFGAEADDHTYTARRIQPKVEEVREKYAIPPEAHLDTELGDTRNAVAMLEKMLPANPTGTIQDAALRFSIVTLQLTEKEIWDLLVEGAVGTNDFKDIIQNQLRDHHEAYENQAVNDYNQAQAANPERYPEPLTYGEHFEPPTDAAQAPAPTPENPAGQQLPPTE